MKKVLLAALVAVLFSGCASIVTGTAYNVPINSTPNQANVTIVNRKGEQVFSGKTPAVARLEASSKYMSGESYEITISKPGFEEQKISLNGKLDGWYFGNILFGGLIGMLIIDPLTGAMYKLNETPIYVSLEESTDTAATLQIIDINTLTDDQRKNLVKID